MKKLQMYAIFFFAASAVDLCAGKTIRNSAEQPMARKNFLAGKKYKFAMSPVLQRKHIKTTSIQPVKSKK